VPLEGFYEEVFNTDAERYGGSNLGNLGGKFTDQWSIHGYGHSLDLCLPPLSVLVFRRDAIRSLPAGETIADRTGADRTGASPTRLGH
jgi:1,4-alpha-glucan branching enzyme